MPERHRARSSVRTAVIWDVLRSVIAERSESTGRAKLDVVDVGGGTGGFAVPIAELGHRVTVIDPNPDALAALDRRVAEADLSRRVQAVQGEAGAVAEILGTAAADVVLCHGVLEYVDDPAAALGAINRCLRKPGTVSVLCTNRNATVLARALSGRFEEALQVLSDPDGRYGEHDLMPRRFTIGQVSDLVRTAGLVVEEVHGVRIFSDLVPGGSIDAEPGALDALLGLESIASTQPDFQAIATQIHLLAIRD